MRRWKAFRHPIPRSALPPTPAEAAFLQGGDAPALTPERQRIQLGDSCWDGSLPCLQTPSTDTFSVQRLPPAGIGEW